MTELGQGSYSSGTRHWSHYGAAAFLYRWPLLTPTCHITALATPSHHLSAALIL